MRKRKEILILAALVICLAQASAFWLLRRDIYLPSPPRLTEFTFNLAGWTSVVDETVDPDAIAMLSPDDYLARVYQSTDPNRKAELFIAYYKTQLRAKNAHDPKVCLPGSGWNPLESHVSYVSLPSERRSFPALYYLIEKDGAKEVVLYWFQTLRGAYTYEQQLRLQRIIDAIEINRTDVALVRISVPVTGSGVEAAGASAVALARDAYMQMIPYFPPGRRS